MTSLYSPQAYHVKTTTYPNDMVGEPESRGGGCGAWIIFIIILLLVIAGLIVWLILSYRRNPDDRKIELAGANVEVTSDTTITASWNQTSSTEDVITLYATLNPPVYNSSGRVINSSQIFNKATGSNTSVTLGKLQAGLKYYATLVVTNPGTSNYAVYNQIVYMQSKQPPTDVDFEIGNILQVGRIEVDDDQVFFRQAPAEESAVLFTVNSDGYLQNGDLCLYTDAGNNVNESDLKAAECTNTTLVNKSTASWIYNNDGLANR